jgi:hypothetical protein
MKKLYHAPAYPRGRQVTTSATKSAFLGQFFYDFWDVFFVLQGAVLQANE